MKNENIFETDTPALELESRTLRNSQQGQHVPYVNGISINPYTGAAIHAAYAPLSQQPGFANIQGLASQQLTPNYNYPGVQQQLPYSNYVQPPFMGLTPAFYGNPYPAPYFNNPYPGNYINQYTPLMQGQWMNTPFTQPVQPQLTGLPLNQPNLGLNPVPQNPNYQPAINIADGQYTFLPGQQTQGTTRNGSQLPKNGERDFISWFPTVNILETDRSFKIEIAVPGVARENCRINVDKNNILRITGTRRWNQESDAVGFTRKEFNYGSFACSFVLTENLQKEKITSSCRNGLLIVSIPKRDVMENEDRSFSEISVN